MKGLMAKMLLPCEKASLLVIKREEGKITSIEKFQLAVHHLICGLCKEFDEQNEFMNLNIKRHYQSKDDQLQFSSSEKDKLKSEILKNEKL